MTYPPITIRPLAAQDLPTITSIYNEQIINTANLFLYTPVTLENRQAWFQSLRERGYPALVAVESKGDNEVVLGWCCLGPFRSFAAYQFTVEVSVYLDREARSKGIGKTLMARIIEAAKEKGYHTMIAVIAGENTISSQFYGKLGFREVGTLKEVGYKFDRWIDVHLYELLL